MFLFSSKHNVFLNNEKLRKKSTLVVGEATSFKRSQPNHRTQALETRHNLTDALS
jgi:hypothetical protein